MKHIKKMKIDIDKKNFEVIPSVQYDSNTRFLHINLLNGSVPFNLTRCSVKISGTKPDGTAIFNNCTVINAKEGFIEVELTEQMNAAPGTLKCELKLYSGSGVLTTKQFYIEVTASVTSKNVTSGNEFKALEEALSKVNNIDTKFESLTAETVKAATEKEIQKQIANGNMANLTIANGSITQDKLSPNIKFGIEDGEVTNRKLAKESVTKEKIKDGEITPAKLSNEILIKDYAQGSTNLFNKFDIVVGYVDKKTGNIAQSGAKPSDRASGFVEVEPSTKYVRNPQGSISTGNRTIAFYDTGKGFILGTTFEQGTYTFATPSNCKYIRFGFLIEDIEKEYIKRADAVKSQMLTGYKLKPSIIGDGDITLNKLSDEFFNEKTDKKHINSKLIANKSIAIEQLAESIVEDLYAKNNLFNKNDVVVGYIGKGDGNVYTSGLPTDRSSGFIAVKGGIKYKRNPQGSISTGNRTICFYNEEKGFISGNTYSQGDHVFSTPSNCKYIRFSFAVDDLDVEYICLESADIGFKINKDLLPSSLSNNSNNNSSSVENMGETGLMTKAMFDLNTNTSKYKQGMVSPDGTEHVISVTNDGEFLAIPKVHFDFPKEYGFTVTGRSLVNDEMYICGPRTKFISILNSKGYVKWYKPLKIGGYNFRKLTSDKGEIRYLYADKNGKSQVATNGGFTYNDLVIMNDKFVELKRVALLASGSIADGFPMEDHDYIYFNDDHCIIPTYHPNIVTNVPNTGGTRCKVLNCVLQEIKNGQVVFHWESINHPEFYTLSHFNNDFTAYHENQNIYNDYMHINSFVIDKRDGNLLVSARHIGFFKINRTTGELMWVIGKNRCDFSGVTANMIPSMQHDAKYNYDNSITLYDNSGCPTDNARICRYWLDEENLKLEKFKEYITPYKRSPHMGGATLIDDELELFDISFGGDPGTFPVGWHEYSFKHKKEYLNYKHDNENMFYRIFRNEKYGRQE